jgi:hypothetical protein
VFELLQVELRAMRLTATNYRWVEARVTRMKLERRMAPGTIRKRVSALAIALDSHHLRQEKTWAHPLRLLPRGYASYGDEDTATLVEQEYEARKDVERNRRLEDGEEKRILATLPAAGTSPNMT